MELPAMWNTSNHQRSPPPPTGGAATTAVGRNRTWDENFHALLLYKEEHGSTEVPHQYAQDRVLAKWCSHLRENYAAGQLSKERIDALEGMGFVWNPHERKWNENYSRLVAYWKENGHSKVPTVYKADPTLGKWVSRQREDFSIGSMNERRKKKLDALGFVWRVGKGATRQQRRRPEDDRWDQRYQELVEYYNTYGNSNVPRPANGSGGLSGWVGGQRLNYSRGLLSQDRINKLKKVGFIFNFNEKKKQEEWNKMYELLKVCQKVEGGFELSIVGDESTSLSRWIQRQREKYKLHKLEPGREHLLRKLDFSFPTLPPKEEEDAESEVDINDNLFGAECGQMQQVQRQADISMVDAIVDLAGEDEDLGKRVAESIALLSQFMSMSKEELAMRLSTPMGGRSATRGGNAADTGKEENAFGILLPLMVSLQETANESSMRDCAEFLLRMVQIYKPEGARSQDPDCYNELLMLAVELSQELDNSQRSKAVVESCRIYFQHILARGGEKKSNAAAKNVARDALEQDPAAKRSRTTEAEDEF